MAEIFSVSQISTYIRGMFSTNSVLNHIYVKGEVSNCKYHSSGHIYFTLKDQAAQIACVMFAGRRTGISFRLADGQSVIVFGAISVYERDGKYQLYADEIRQDGIGRLYEEFEYLKQKLAAEGLFAQEHKKPICRYAKKIGIITAATGAAIHDIMQISKRRNPYIQLLLYPAKVQGEGAAQTIVQGIRRLDGMVDTIIVGRGGGSIEDLWAFNEECVARAVFECQTPVISAVGHETDVTIVDFVSDLRAPTPSAAAELAVYDIRALEQLLAGCHSDMADAFLKKTERLKQQLKQKELQLKQFHPKARLTEKRRRLLDIEEGLSRELWQKIQKSRQRTAILSSRLKGLSPMERLSGGYAFVTDQNGAIVTRTEQITEGDSIQAEITDGTLFATVTKILPREEH